MKAHADTARAKEQRSPSLGAIFFTVFLDLLGFGLVLPFLSIEARDLFGAGAFVATLLGSSYSFMQFLFVPVWGRLSDRVGRRPVLLWSIGATAASMAGLGVALAFGSSVVWLFLARVFSGIATANLWTASAYIADITKPEERARGMGLIGAAFGLGFIVGPGLGGVLAEIPVAGRKGPLPCFLAALLSLVNLAWAFKGLKESLPAERRSAGRRSLAPLDVGGMRRAFRHPGVALAVLVNALIVLSFTNLDQTFTFFCKDLFAMGKGATGLLFAFIGVLAALVQGGLIRPLSRRVTDVRVLRWGVWVQFLSFLGLAFSPTLGRGWLYGSSGALAVGNGLSQPSSASFISRSTSVREQGEVLGTNQAFASLSRGIGPAMGGLLYEHVAPKAPYLVAAVGMLLALLLARRLPAEARGPTP